MAMEALEMGGGVGPGESTGVGPVGMIFAPALAALGRGPFPHISNFLGGLTGRDPNPKISAMRGVVNQINSALAQGPNPGLISPVNIFGKGNVGNPLGPIISKFAIPGRGYSDEIINKKVNYALNKTDEAQREFTSLLTKGGIQRTDELVEVELSKILRDTNKTGLIRRGDVKAQFTGKKFRFGNMTVERLRESLKNEIISRQPGRGGISQISNMQSKNITEAFTKALEYAFETKMGEPAGHGQYTPEMPTVQDPEPTTEPGLITEPEPTPVETPTEPEPTPVETPTEPPTETPSDQGLFSDEAIAQFFTDEEQKAIVTNLEKAKATQADADATPSDKNDAWGKVALGLTAGAGLYGLLKLFQPRNGETTDGDINNLPRLNLNLPSSNRLGLNFSNTGGLTPVPPPALAELPTGVQSGRGIPLGKLEYKDDYVGYPLL